MIKALIRTLIKINKFFVSKKHFYNPKKTKFLFYDSETYRFNKHILKKKDHLTIDVRYESFYFKILFKSILLFLQQRELTLLQVYIVQFINYCEPEFVITFTNYDIFFWRLKKYIRKESKTVIIQNTQVNGEDFKKMSEDMIFGKNKKKMSEKQISQNINKTKFEKGKVNYLITFGKSVHKKYMKVMKTENIVSGSMRNNLFKNPKNVKKRDIAFISTFKHRLFDKGVFVKKNGQPISFPEAKLTQDKIILSTLSKFCKKNNLKLNVIARGWKKENLVKEKEYFKNIIGNNFKFIEKKHRYDSYKFMRRFKYLVFVSSSLGYEALSLGKRVAAINAYHSLFNLSGGKNFRYAWPENIPLKGPFWTNSHSEKEILRVLKFILKAKNNTWFQLKKKFIDPTIIYDFKNIKIKKKLNEIGLKLL